MPEAPPKAGGIRVKTRIIIFESDTPAGKWFDVLLIVAILASVGAVLLASMESLQARWGGTLRAIEWVFTILFTVEYIARLWSIGNPRRYAISFFGIVDLLAIAPTYLSLFLPGVEFLIVIRSLRALRVFRVLKLLEYVDGANLLLNALWASRHKIIVFIIAVSTLVTIIGSAMYLIEGEQSGFSSIPVSIYWAIVTLTTVGYGDISPVTPLGQIFSSIVMLIGYAIIAVPTGIVTAEITLATREQRRRALAPGRITGQTAAVASPVAEYEASRACVACGAQHHQPDARYCRKCGSLLPGQN